MHFVVNNIRMTKNFTHTASQKRRVHTDIHRICTHQTKTNSKVRIRGRTQKAVHQNHKIYTNSLVINEYMQHVHEINNNNNKKQPQFPPLNDPKSFTKPLIGVSMILVSAT